MGMQARFCRDCGAHLMFVRLVSGALIPVDRAPDTGTGNVCAIRTGSNWSGYVASQDRPARVGGGWRRFVPHAATCSARHEKRPHEKRPAPPVLDPLF